MKKSIRHLSESSLRLFLVCLVAGCSSTTLINSKPPGAKLYIDGAYRGVTPYKYSDSKIVGSSTPLKFTKDGYQDLETTLSRSERPDVGAIVGGVFFLFPFLWTMQYDSEHFYDLQPMGAASAKEAVVKSEDLETRLKELKKMLDDGSLTQDEYNSLRKRAIDNAK